MELDVVNLKEERSLLSYEKSKNKSVGTARRMHHKRV